jgi:hypothetical protein
MIWVFGIAFLTLVILFAYWLAVKSQAIRRKLETFSRNRRLLLGVGGCLLAFGSAYAALVVATSVPNWNQPPSLQLTAILTFMLLFVGLQVGAMLCIVSIATDSETTDRSKRS